MVQYIITPWRDRDELIKVRQAFYQKPSNGGSPDKEAWQNAVALVSVWAQRGNCPHLIESTALLISASVNDKPGSSAYAVRAAYSAAFCRFVTGLLDGYQDKKHKLSMFSIAKNIGLPATFVELRHQCTHEELPSLGKLRGACERSLDWIWRQYWSSLEGKDKSSGSDEEPESVEDLSTVLQEYMVWKEGTGSSDEGQRLSFVRRLRKWDVEKILDTLHELRAPGAADSGMMLKSIRLTRGILHGTADPEAFPPVEEEDSNAGNGQGDAACTDSNAVQQTSSGLCEDEENLGWKLWEGPWTPKPIGTV
ncbi:rRNA-processing protein las1 [Pseudogymnoascus verrucosus]|uniref:rRNA-processing protein las1 n=1 Tax=Pseudogymnoascus verrucosus TaxID=342668 RepID=A0A1B8GW08_9PEZI|nr:rRNA-processing protein las1 [Pseudogymnoascus verrucosus]OBU00015.1 rRNA-processing protein las1 [Pseudogymnoascus verrucosus]